MMNHMLNHHWFFDRILPHVQPNLYLFTPHHTQSTPMLVFGGEWLSHNLWLQHKKYDGPTPPLSPGCPRILGQKIGIVPTTSYLLDVLKFLEVLS